ncbi:MAG: electron transport complex subunit RsxB [Pseudomonas sp.]|uniref:electron transport complex subunit RsxB n=1 Tax=Pseudomonas sp. TaxID=306 RepID=UPI0033996405
MNLIPAIDALLPQTQCGKCGHPGCLPYAQGIAAGEAINKCPPGGEETLAALADLLRVPVIPLDRERGAAPAQVAYIREAECIGCTKCIQACPVDAILGAAKLMHTVLIDECTGCDLCVAPCPVDCIEMHPLPLRTPQPVVAVVGGLAGSPEEKSARTAKRDQARRRFQQRQARLQREGEQRAAQRLARAEPRGPQNTLGASPALDPVQAAIARVKAQKAAQANLIPDQPAPASDEAGLKKGKVEAAMTRAQLNKSYKAFGSPPTAAQHAQLAELHTALDRAEQHLAGLLAAAPASTPVAVDDSALKRAKIQLALKRADLKKAQSAAAPAAELLTLGAALRQAEQALHAAEAACGKPPPDLQRIDKAPVDERLRALKTERAYARAELSTLQRLVAADPQQLQAAEARLSTVQQQLADYARHD